MAKLGFGYFEILISILWFFMLCFFRKRKRNSPITNWPVLGMLPGLLTNSSQIHEYVTFLMNQTHGTLEFHGPMFPKLDYLVTCDPHNVHHIFSKNFSNFQKGFKFKQIFEFLGNGIFISDGNLWKNQRKFTHSIIKNQNFLELLEKTTQEKLKNGVLPVLGKASNFGIEVDFQDLFQRFTFDCTWVLMFGEDPCSLSPELDEFPPEKAMDDITEVMLYWHIVPEKVWKFQKWLKIGKEKKLAKAIQILDEFVYQQIALKRQKMKSKQENYDLISFFMEKTEQETGDELRDVAVNLLVAGRDTVSVALTWVFWVLAKDASIERKIMEEISEKLKKNEEKQRIFNTHEANKLVYLHGTICEALRLYPPVPFNHKTTIESDVLPSGHKIDRKTEILISIYAMGRMEWIWGEDCLEFRPERWLTESGRIRHEGSYKFMAFNAGPRSCLGKEMSFVEMKIVVASIVWNFHVKIVENQDVCPVNSIILRIQNGLKVRLVKRFM